MDQSTEPTAVRDRSTLSWLAVWRRYLGSMLLLNLAWEFAQLPLYTIWHEASLSTNLLAAAHCALGDLLIATATLMLALILTGDDRWPASGFWRVAGVTMLLGMIYATFSEWLNIVVRQSWKYSVLMPTLPILGTGLAPLAQWLVLPALSLKLARTEHAAWPRCRHA